MVSPIPALSSPIWSARRCDGVVLSCGFGRSFLASNDLATGDGQTADGVALVHLLQRCGAGDRHAFRRLYEREAPRLYGLALRITRQPSLAADAVHDALLQVWQRASSFDVRRGSPEAWLTGLVRYRAIDVVRKRARETSGLEVPDLPDTAPGPLDSLLATTAGSALHHCLDRLDEPQRRVILLAFVDGLSHSELAQRLGAPLGTVKSWIRRGLVALKACLEP